MAQQGQIALDVGDVEPEEPDPEGHERNCWLLCLMRLAPYLSFFCACLRLIVCVPFQCCVTCLHGGKWICANFQEAPTHVEAWGKSSILLTLLASVLTVVGVTCGTQKGLESFEYSLLVLAALSACVSGIRQGLDVVN